MPTTPRNQAFIRRIYESDKLIVLFALATAIGIRTLVISSNPTFLLGGDTPGYVAYVQEVIRNGFMIPTQNAIHFPGSYWVYPPLLPYFWAILTHLLGNGPITPFYVIEISGMLIDALVVIPVFMIAKLVFGKKTAVVSAFMFTVYLPDLFALSWGGVPQLFATFLFAWVIYFTILISREESRSLRNTVVLGVVLIILTLTHDLSIFVMIFSILAVIILSLMLQRIKIRGLETNAAHLKSVVRKLPLSLLIALPLMLVWYIPRYWWIIDAGAPYINSNLPAVFTQTTATFSLVFQGMIYFLSPLSFAVLLIPLAVWSIYWCLKHMPEKSGVLLVFAILPILISVVDFHDPIIVGRMGYYTFLPALVITSHGLISFWNSHMEHRKEVGMKNTGSSNRSQKVAAAVIIIPFLMVSTFGVSANMTAHSFYNSYLDSSPSNVIDYSTLNWIHSNIPRNSTFASYGEFGYYIMGFDGNPTLVYQSLKYLTQPAEWNESIAAYDLVYAPSANVNMTMHLISKYNVDYVTTSGNVSVPSFYTEVYHDGNTTIYHV